MSLHDAALADAEAVFYGSLAEVMMPPPPVNYIDWAKENIVFSERISAKAGRYNEAAFPFFSEILEALSPDDPCQVVTLIKSAQVGGTVAANIFTLGSMAMDPGDLLYVHPTDGNAIKWSRQKLTPLLKETTALASLFPLTSREGANSVTYKERKDGRGAISAAGANSPASLSMVSPKRQVQDDLSKWENNPAGDPEMQADSRSKAFFNRKVFKISTPLVVPGCRITRNWQEGSQEEYHVPCPHCGHLQALRWENMEQHLDPDRPEKAAFLCVAPDCGGFIEEHHRTEICRPVHLGGQARWVAKYPERKRWHRSFYIWVAYSSLESWVDLARRWLAVKAGRAGAAESREAEQVFWNDYIGRAFEGVGETLPWEDLRDRAAESGFRRGVVPPGALILTLGIDCQGDRVEWQLVGWGRWLRRYVIDYGIFDSQSVKPGEEAHTGHISEPQIKARLDELLARTWPDWLGNKRGVDATAIDGNYSTTDVFEWAKRHPVSKVIMVRGVHQEYAAILSLVRNEKDHKGKARKYRKRFFNLAVSVLKLTLYRALKKTDAEATGFVHFAKGLPDTYFEQLVSEKRVPKKTTSGHTEYRWELPDGYRNEALDTMNAAFGAAYRLGIYRWDDDDWDKLAAQVEVPPASPQFDLEDNLLTPSSTAAAKPAAAGQINSRVAAARVRAAAAMARKGNS